MPAVAPNLDHIANTEPGIRGKEGNDVLWWGVKTRNADRTKDKRDPVVWPMKRVIVRGERENKEGAKKKEDTRGE